MNHDTSNLPLARRGLARLNIGCARLIFGLLAGMSIWLGGCQHRSVMQDDLAAVPWERDSPWRQADSSVMLTPDARLALRDAGWDMDAPAWYDSRRDELPGVTAPNQTQVVYQRSVTLTRDYYGTSNGRVRDQSHTHTYNLRIEATTPR